MAGKFWQVMEKIGLAETVEDTPPAEAPVKPTGSVPAPAQVLPRVATVDPAVQAKLAELDKSARQQLSQAMEAAGASLVEELGETLETLKESGVEDEKVRYTAAIKSLIKKGHPVSAICQDMDKCIGVLEDKNREFSSQLKGQFDKRVGSKTQTVQTCDDQIAAKIAQKAKLDQEIADLTTQKAEAQQGIHDEQNKLTQVGERFDMAYKAIRSEVESQRAKIAQYGEKL
jgi:hypothetical protein